MGFLFCKKYFAEMMDEAGFDAKAQSMFPPVAHLISGCRRER